MAAKETSIGPFCSLIAGATLSAGTILETRSTSEFTRVPGLVVEN